MDLSEIRTCEHCHEALDLLDQAERPNKRHCNSTCRARASRNRKAKRGSSHARGRKAQGTAARRDRRRVRRRHGTDLYVLPDEVELVRTALARVRRSDQREHLLEKVERAGRRLGDRA